MATERFSEARSDRSRDSLTAAGRVKVSGKSCEIEGIACAKWLQTGLTVAFKVAFDQEPE